VHGLRSLARLLPAGLGQREEEVGARHLVRARELAVPNEGRDPSASGAFGSCLRGHGWEDLPIAREARRLLVKDPDASSKPDASTKEVARVHVGNSDYSRIAPNSGGRFFKRRS
jgi:hypothetical protein